MRITARLTVVLCVLVVLLPAPSSADDPAQVAASAVEKARRLRETAQFEAAATLLAQHLQQHPADAQASAMLAQTLYWAGRHEAARASYEQALRRHPESNGLRLDYARMLLETKDFEAARGQLRMLPAGGDLDPERATLLGTIDYWQGRLNAARRHFRAALAIEPQHPQARAQLAEIEAAAVPWLGVRSEVLSDDQPLDRYHLRLDAGWFVTPLTPLRVRLDSYRFALADTSLDPGDVTAGELAVRHSAPRLHLDLEAAGGLLHTLADAHSEPLWGLELTARLPHRLALRARMAREPYLVTTAAAGAPFATTVAAFALERTGTRSWLAELAYQRDRFDDDNVVTSAHGWILLPVLERGVLVLRAGYAFTFQDAQHSRFARSPDDPQAGRYSPYYTPAELQAHSVATQLVLGRGRTQLRLGASYAAYGVEQRPYFPAGSAADAAPAFVKHEYTPWEARAQLAVQLPAGLSLEARLEHSRAAFYQATRAVLSFGYSFGAAAPSP